MSGRDAWTGGWERVRSGALIFGKAEPHSWDPLCLGTGFAVSPCCLVRVWMRAAPAAESCSSVPKDLWLTEGGDLDVSEAQESLTPCCLLCTPCLFPDVSEFMIPCGQSRFIQGSKWIISTGPGPGAVLRAFPREGIHTEAHHQNQKCFNTQIPRPQAPCPTSAPRRGRALPLSTALLTAHSRD